VLKLVAKSPAEGLVPSSVGTMELSEVVPAAITSIACYKGQADALSAALKEHHGMALPKTGQATGRAGARAMWAGPSVFLVGPEPHADLSNHAAIVDQSDSWCVLNLKGADVEAVLARLSSADMRSKAMKKGQVVRSQLQHMNAIYHRVSDDSFDIYAFRSMAKTMVHDIDRAMRYIATRA
jgi:heterotetrameric sarcosine oxidase gamma subunit